MSASTAAQIDQILQAAGYFRKYFSLILVGRKQLSCFYFYFNTVFLTSFIIRTLPRIVLLFIKKLQFSSKNFNFSIKAIDQAMAKVLPLIGMKNQLSAFIIQKEWRTRNQVCINCNTKYFFSLLIPQKKANFFNIFVSLTKIMLMLIFTATLVKIAFALFRLYFSNIDPFFATKTALWLAEHIILHYLLMFIF